MIFQRGRYTTNQITHICIYTYIYIHTYTYYKTLDLDLNTPMTFLEVSLRGKTPCWLMISGIRRSWDPLALGIAPFMAVYHMRSVSLSLKIS